MFALRMPAKTGGELDGHAKQIVVAFHRFARGDANSHTNWPIGVGFDVFRDFVLDSGGASSNDGRWRQLGIPGRAAFADQLGIDHDRSAVRHD